MTASRLALAGRIRSELGEVETVTGRVEKAWEKARVNADSYYLDSVALNLHSFYGGIERIFDLIAIRVDGSKPEGENWYQELLRQMAAEIPKVRPPVISRTIRDRLDEYRGFRHVVRNVYAFNLNPSRMEYLVLGVSDVFNQLRSEIERFLEFLESSGDGS